MEECHAEFGLFKDHGSSPSSPPYCGCDVVISDRFVELVDVCPNDPYRFAYVSISAMDLSVQMLIWLKIYHLA